MPRYNGEAIKKGCGGGAWSHIHVLMIFLCWKHIKVYVKYGLLYNNCKVFHFIETHTNWRISWNWPTFYHGSWPRLHHRNWPTLDHV